MKKWIVLLLLLPMFSVKAYAAPLPEQVGAITDVSGMMDSLPEDVKEISGEPEGLAYDSQGALRRLWDRLLEQLNRQLRENLRFAAELTALGFFCSMAATLAGNETSAAYIEIAGCCGAAVLMTAGVDSMVGQVTATIDQMVDYSRAALPAVFTAAAATGAAITASARYAAACLAFDVLISASRRFLIPLIYGYLALSLSESMYDNALLQALRRAAKWCATLGMTGLTLAFSAYISLTGLITGSSDAIAVKTTRSLISHTLPVVGGLLADSASVLLSAAAAIKNAAGTASLVAVCALCIGPLAGLLVKMLLYKGAAAVMGLLPSGRLPRLVGDMGTVLGMLLGLLGCCAAILFLSFMSAIKVVAP